MSNTYVPDDSDVNGGEMAAIEEAESSGPICTCHLVHRDRGVWCPKHDDAIDDPSLDDSRFEVWSEP